MKEEYTQPVRVGDKLTTHIINLGEKGDGIAKYQDFVIIIPNAQIEKNYQIKIRKVYNNFAIADIMAESP